MHYIWYAFNEETDEQFSVRTRRHQPGTDEEIIGRALHRVRGKIFLGTWRPEVEYDHDQQATANLPTQVIRHSILRALYRLYEQGLNSSEVHVDLEGVGLELGVNPDLVLRAAEFLEQEDLIASPGAFGRDTHSGDFWITNRGIHEVESRGLPIESFLQDVYEVVLGRVSSLNPALRADLESLRTEVARLGSSRNELVGYGGRVRDFVQELTQQLFERHRPGETIGRDKTINKVAALTQDAASDTDQEHVRALAQVVETHWRRLSDVQQKLVHSGTGEGQRLFAYTVLLVADLFEVMESARRP